MGPCTSTMVSVFTTVNCSFFTDLIVIVTRKAFKATVVIATITMLYLLNMVQLAIQWQLLQLSFVDSGETRKTIFLTTFFNPAWATLASQGCTATTNILADGLLVSTTSTFTFPFMFSHLNIGKIWRCFYAWNRSLLTISLLFFFLSQRQVKFHLREQGALIEEANSLSKRSTWVLLYISQWSN